jgi:hypothetical protein
MRGELIAVQVWFALNVGIAAVAWLHARHRSRSSAGYVHAPSAPASAVASLAAARARRARPRAAEQPGVTAQTPF